MLLLLTSLLCAQPGAAQEAAEARPRTTITDIESLVETLEDDRDREQLVKQLKALIEADRQARGEAAAAPKPDSLGARLLAGLSQKTAAVAENLAVLLPALIDLPEAAAWTWRQARDPAVRASLLKGLGKLLLIFALALVAEWLGKWALAKARRTVEGRPSAGLGPRVLNLLMRTLIDVVPILLFTAAAYLALPVTEPRPTTRLVALVLINANVVVRLVTALANMVFAPRFSQLRLLRLTDETANYAYIWVRRITVVTTYGYVSLEAALLVGLSPTIHASLLKAVGLVVALMLIVLILQNRTAVSDWLRNLKTEAAAMRSLRARLADIWHVLAGGYVLAAYGVWVLEIPGGFEFLLRATGLTAAVLLIAWGVAFILHKALERGFHLRDEVKAQFPGIEARANRYLPVLHRISSGLIYLIAGVAILQAWGFGTFDWLASDFGRNIASRVLTILLMLGAAILVWEVASALIERYLERKAAAGLTGSRVRMVTLLPLLRNALRVILAVMVVLIGLSELGVNIAPLLAGAGVIGLAVGFGAQTMVKDLITGFFILVEDTLALGDYVDLGGHMGTVEGLTIRTVSLRDISGTMHTLPWGEVTSIINMNKDFGYAILDIGIGYREDVDQVFEVIEEIGRGLLEDETYGPDILEPIEIQGVNALGASSVDIRARIKTKPLKQWSLRREFFRRMKRVFDEKDIEIPFPHQTIYFGVDKQGNAPPARVNLNQPAAVAEAPRERAATAASAATAAGGFTAAAPPPEAPVEPAAEAEANGGAES